MHAAACINILAIAADVSQLHLLLENGICSLLQVEERHSAGRILELLDTQQYSLLLAPLVRSACYLTQRHITYIRITVLYMRILQVERYHRRRELKR